MIFSVQIRCRLFGDINSIVVDNLKICTYLHLLAPDMTFELLIYCDTIISNTNSSNRYSIFFQHIIHHTEFGSALIYDVF